MSQDLFVRRVYHYKGVAVCVEIDFAREVISLVEKNSNTYKPKNWKFAERGIDYMTGWQTIFDAMAHAVGEATVLLEAHKKSQTEKFAELLINLEEHRLKNPSKPIKEKSNEDY